MTSPIDGPISPWCRSKAKRTIDVVLSAALVVPLSPVLAVLGVLVRLSMGRPVLWSQTRIGIDASEFTIYKFRTMRDDRGADGALLPESERVTRLGQWMRATSCDELPQLIHVLRGHMSLVGPRPLVPMYVPRYSPRQARRLLVRPGLTGLAQVNGRNALTWEEKFELDVTYVETATFAKDVKILLSTAKQLLPGGEHDRGQIWSEEFLGTEEGSDVLGEPTTTEGVVRDQPNTGGGHAGV